MKGLSVLAAVVLVLVMVQPWGESALIDITPVLSCDPDCTGTNTGDKVVNPRNCSEYFYCINGVPADHATPCDKDSPVFNPESQACEVGECDAVCGAGDSGCPLTCNGTVLVIGDAFDCSTYYYCGPAGPSAAQTCPSARPHFNGTTCVDDDSVCCSGYCEAYCDGSGFSMVPDPNDCTKFYICDTTPGAPTEDFLFSCPDDQYYDIQLGDCSSDVPSPCQTLCEAAGGGSSGSSNDIIVTTSITGNGCVSSLTCPAEGYYAACDSCQPEFFSCSGAGAAGVPGTCDDGLVFNPSPGPGICMLPSNCPYTG